MSDGLAANNQPANSDDAAAATLSTADDAQVVADSAEAKAALEAAAATAKATADAAAAEKAAADAKAETDRRAALTQEQRDAEDKAKADAEKTKSKAPEKYEFKAPEGVALDAEFVTALEQKAKDLGLSQEAAQELYDLGVKAALKDRDSFTAKVTETQASWLAAAQADKEFGGDQLAANMAIAKKALDFATPEFKAMLNQSKLGNHPEVVRFMFRIGKAMSEDGFVRGEVNRERDTSDEGRAARLYGKK
jgi:hypothetical protein